MAAAARKKALVLSLTLGTFSVDKKVSERRNYGMSDRSVLRARKRRTIFNLQRSAAQSLLLIKESSAAS